MVTSLSGEDQARLQEFLSAAKRPEGTLSYDELWGFMFAVVCAPEMIAPSDWLPVIFADEAAQYASEVEAEDILGMLVTVYNDIVQNVDDGAVELPPGCRFADHVLGNFSAGHPLSGWCRGFATGYDWLCELWDEFIPDEISNEYATMIMVMSFFSSRDLAEAFLAELDLSPGEDVQARLIDISTQVQEDFLQVMEDYAVLGETIRMAREDSVDEPDIDPGDDEHQAMLKAPCPCRSGKSFGECCGSVLH